MASKKEELEHAIFGGSDSELSEEDEIQVRRHSPAFADEESSAESVDEYRSQAKPTKQKKARKSRAAPEGEKERKARKRKRPTLTKEDLEAMDPADAKKAQLNMTIEAILKTRKGVRGKKKKKDADEEQLDRFADEEVSRLREAMIAAAEEDIQSNRERQPATSKLRMLPQVMDVLQKQSLWASIIDNNLLEGVRRWLEPLPDKSLPALNIQNAFFETMPKMDIDTNSLKESGLGRIVLFYTKCKRVTGHINQIANTLVSNWSRPIIKRSASYKDRQIPLAGRETQLKNEKLVTIIKRAAAQEPKKARANAVSIPTSSFGSYQIAPRSGMGVAGNTSVDNEVERRRRNAERLRALTRNMSQGGR